MNALKDKTLFITGASRGIGKAIALRAAADGANIVVAAKTTVPHPKLPGTIYSAAEEIKAAGGKALPIAVDVRDETQVQTAVQQTLEAFGSIDILINNASSISMTGTLDTSMKRYDLMQGVNVRGTFVCSQACIPYLKNAPNPHILNISPPLNMEPRWFQNHVAYTISKYGMSMCALGMSAELADFGIAVNTLWPRTLIATAALMVFIKEPKDLEMIHEHTRKPEIMADAAYAILTRDSRTCTGNFYIDEDVLSENGITDFSQYSMKPGGILHPDLFVT